MTARLSQRPRQRGAILLSVMILIMLIQVTAMMLAARQLAQRGRARRAYLAAAARVLARSGLEAALAAEAHHGHAVPHRSFPLGRATGDLGVTVHAGTVVSHARVTDSGSPRSAEVTVEAQLPTGLNSDVLSYHEY